MKVEIGDNCWICSNVTILKGTRIGKNCVIGAGTVLSGNIPDNSIVKSNRSLKVEKIRGRIYIRPSFLAYRSIQRSSLLYIRHTIVKLCRVV